MESWSCVSGGKGIVSDDSVSAPNTVGRGKNGMMGCELKIPCSFGSNVVCSTQEAIESHGFAEPGFPEMVRNTDSIRDVLSRKVCDGRLLNLVTSTPNAFSGEEESSSKLSSSVVDSNCRDSSFIDLKLGRFADHRDAWNFKASKATPNLSSSESSMTAKRLRVGGLSSSAPFCQVYGCKKDLSSCKDYHKRHKVCEVHSKTAKVIVNGIEQRFCQQCSRFHLLAEFDDGKRSCRKRLAGHNERRRKPLVRIHSGRTGRLFQSYNGSAGSRFQGTTFATSSFIFQDILPSSYLHSRNIEANDWCRHIKLEDGADYSPQSAIPIANGHVHPKSFFPSYGFEKQGPPFHDNGVDSAMGSKVNENNSRYPHNVAESNFVSRSLFQSTSIGSNDFTVFDSASTIQGLSGISDSERAFSLLSSQSQNSSSHSSGIPMAHPMIIPGSQYSVPVKLLGPSPQVSTSIVSNKFHSSTISSAEETHLEPILISDGSDALNFVMDGIFQGSDYMSAKDRQTCEGGSTINLLQLSSQLHRVDHQRQSMQVKRENDPFCGLRIT